MQSFGKWLLRLLSVALAAPMLYYLCAVIGAAVPASGPVIAPGTDVLIGLARGPFRYDLMLPLGADVREEFAFASAQGLHLDNAQAEWLLIGRSGQAMLASPGAGPMLQGMMGDAAGLELSLAGNVQGVKGLRFFTLSEPQFAALLAAVNGSFIRDQARAPIALQPDRSIYRATGRSSILYNGNQWVGDMLRQAGVPFGAWTPTPQSVGFSLDWHGLQTSP